MTLEGPTAPFTAHLVLPVGAGPHALVVHVPGVGMHGLMDGLTMVSRGLGDPGNESQGSLAELGMGTLAITVDVDRDGVPRLDLPRSEIRELVGIATEWAIARDDVATEGHVVVGTDFGAAAAGLIGDDLGAELVMWYRPEVRTVGEYIEDELLRRDWFRRRRGDDDGDGSLSPEEWGAYRVSSSAPEDQGLSFSDIDLDGDGRYTVADDELEGEASWTELQSLLDGADDPAWTAFWRARERPDEADGWQGHLALAWPSPAWARDAWDGPAALPQLAIDGAPIVIFVYGASSPMATPLPEASELGRADLRPLRPRFSGDVGAAVYSCLRARLWPDRGNREEDPCRR